MLRFDNLTKSFGGKRALAGLSLAIPNGQFVGIIGRSGAGKSTLIRLINRLIEPTGGDILFDDKSIIALKGKELREWRADCAMIFQQFNLVGRLDVLTNVLVGRVSRTGAWATMFKAFAPKDRARALDLLERLSLLEQALQPAQTLSGGQQQRVAIARALMQEPRVILADEPVASLDPRNVDAVMDELLRINREDGITVLANLHDLDLARRYCDRIIGIAEGGIAFDGLPREFDEAAEIRVYGPQAKEGKSDETHGRPKLAVAH